MTASNGVHFLNGCGVGLLLYSPICSRPYHFSPKCLQKCLTWLPCPSLLLCHKNELSILHSLLPLLCLNYINDSKLHPLQNTYLQSSVSGQACLSCLSSPMLPYLLLQDPELLGSFLPLSWEPSSHLSLSIFCFLPQELPLSLCSWLNDHCWNSNIFFGFSSASRKEVFPIAPCVYFHCSTYLLSCTFSLVCLAH